MGHGESRSDGIHTGPESIDSRCHRAARENLWLQCRERSLLGTQSLAHGAAPAELGTLDPRSDGHCRTPGRQHRVRSEVTGSAAAADWPLVPLQGRHDRLGRLAASIRQAFVARLQRVVELDSQRVERTPWSKTVWTCRQLLQVADGFWTFLEVEGIKLKSNVAERAPRQSVIERKISQGVQSRQGEICRSRLLTLTTTFSQQSHDTWQFLDQTWNAFNRGVMGWEQSLLQDHWAVELRPEHPHYLSAERSEMS